MKVKEIDWIQVYTKAKDQLEKLDINPEYVCMDRQTSSHGDLYSDALVTIHIPVRGNRKEIDVLMKQNNFCKLRGENKNGVRYMCGWLSFKIEK